MLHFKSLKCPQICETHAETASVEKSASHLHILRLQNKAHVGPELTKAFCRAYAQRWGLLTADLNAPGYLELL